MQTIYDERLYSEDVLTVRFDEVSKIYQLQAFCKLSASLETILLTQSEVNELISALTLLQKKQDARIQ